MNKFNTIFFSERYDFEPAAIFHILESKYIAYFDRQACWNNAKINASKFCKQVNHVFNCTRYINT